VHRSTLTVDFFQKKLSLSQQRLLVQDGDIVVVIDIGRITGVFQDGNIVYRNGSGFLIRYYSSEMEMMI